MTGESTEVCVTETFGGHLYLFLKEFPAAEDDFIAGYDALENYIWDGSLDINKHGRDGKTFSYEFTPGYVVTFKRETERDVEKKPIRVILYLKTIERIK